MDSIQQFKERYLHPHRVAYCLVTDGKIYKDCRGKYLFRTKVYLKISVGISVRDVSNYNLTQDEADEIADEILNSPHTKIHKVDLSNAYA